MVELKGVDENGIERGRQIGVKALVIDNEVSSLTLGKDAIEKYKIEINEKEKKL